MCRYHEQLVSCLRVPALILLSLSTAQQENYYSLYEARLHYQYYCG